jgi:hypothetical protein
MMNRIATSRSGVELRAAVLEGGEAALIFASLSV